MAERDWLRPQAPVEAGGTAWATRPQARFELRPLSLGEALDRTFALYRSRFWLFAGISMIAASLNVVAQGISLASAHKLANLQPGATAPNAVAALANLRSIGAAQAGTYLALLVFVLVSAVTQAATAFAVTEVYLERPVTVEASLRTVGPRWYRWIGIAIWQACSAVWIPLAGVLPGAILLGVAATQSNTTLIGVGAGLMLLGVLAGFPLGFIMYLRNALAVPAAVTEGLTIRPAMRRSKVLAAGTKGRIFVVLLIAGCLLEIVAVLQAPAALLMVMSPNQEHYLARGIALLVTFIGHTVVAPVALIGLTLLYFDQRVRKEAFDLQLLLEDAREPASVAETSGTLG